MNFYYFSGVNFTAGVVKCLIYNINNGRYKQFDIELFNMLKDLHGKKINFEIDEFAHLLVNEGWGFVSPSQLLISKPEEFFEEPNLIDNCIIDYEPENIGFNLISVLDQFNKLRCKAVLIRIYSPIKYSYVVKLKKKLEKFNFEYFQLVIKLVDPKDLFEIEKLGICVHVYNWTNNQLGTFSEHITTSSSNLQPHENCGFVNQFTVNIKHYMESLSYNSCLNAKVGIDIFGNIKNCPSDQVIYGNVNRDDLLEVVKTNEFQKKWHIKKDQINTCKRCEYRYICTDCRVYTMNDKLFEKPKHCKYDPYTGSWHN